MPKRIKFPLEMGDGTQARSMEELKAHFDIDKVVEYTLDGKLVTWLDARYYTKEAEAVKRLDIHSEGAKGELCAIFGVEISDGMSEVDVEAIQLRKERLLKLKGYTDREEIWDKIDNVAFDQEELGDRLDEDCQEIYLCGEMFTIPYSVKDKVYIGVNMPDVRINEDDDKIDLKESGIEIKDCNLLNQLDLLSCDINTISNQLDPLSLLLEKLSLSRDRFINGEVYWDRRTRYDHVKNYKDIVATPKEKRALEVADKYNDELTKEDRKYYGNPEYRGHCAIVASTPVKVYISVGNYNDEESCMKLYEADKEEYIGLLQDVFYRRFMGYPGYNFFQIPKEIGLVQLYNRVAVECGHSEYALKEPEESTKEQNASRPLGLFGKFMRDFEEISNNNKE